MKRKPRTIRWDSNGSNRFLLFAQDRERNCTLLIYERTYASPTLPGGIGKGNAAIEWTPADPFDGTGGRETDCRFEFDGTPAP